MRTWLPRWEGGSQSKGRALVLVFCLAPAAALVGPAGAGLAFGGQAASVARLAADGSGTSSVGTGSATFNGSVDPNGRQTKAHFEYGIDQRYRPPGYTGGVYDQSTADQDMGSGFQYVPITASVSGLIPHAVYHMRLVAVNSGGTAFGPDQTFTTREDPAPGSPVFGQTENVTPSGSVFFFAGGTQIPLTEPRRLPLGTVINALGGSVKLVAASGRGGGRYTATFRGGVWKFSQTRAGANNGLTTVSLVEGAYSGGPSYAACKAKRGSAKKVLQSLHVQAAGRFVTRGHYALVTGQNSKWSITERCDGTLVSVQLHQVAVADLVKHSTVQLRAGHGYLAKK